MTDNKNDISRNAWAKMEEDSINESNNINQEYLHFLNRVKTEREAVEYISSIAVKQGFVSMDTIDMVKSGQKIVLKQKNKVCALIVIGTQPLIDGVNMVVSHIDSPRIDLKARPVYEADNLALFKTHYYGGIKKYQWTALPLALHGVVVKKNGHIINIRIGEKEEEFVFTIADLLPHLAKNQMEKKMSEAIKGEDLNVLIGSQPLKGVENEPVKKHILKILKEKYSIEEDDFTSAELELVPAFKAREVGFDQSMIGAYGQDDRVSAYTSLRAILDIEQPTKTAVCLFVDKEEIGSTGNTGLQSLIIENLIVEILHKTGQGDYYSVRKCLLNSSALSADVNAAVDPTYSEVFEKMNCSLLSNGVVLTKFTGSRGKVESNDANPEFIGKIRQLFDSNEVTWQIGELGKVDIGGGGTVAQYLARYGIEVVDCGVAVLGMHSPFEVVSKADVYMAYKAYKAFLQLY